MAHAAGAPVLVDGAQAAPHMRGEMQLSAPTSTASRAIRSTGRPGSASSTAPRSLLEQMPPFLAGGDMISQGRLVASRPGTRCRGSSRPARAPYVEATGLGAAVDWLDALGLDAVAAHEADVTAYAVERLSDVPG